MDEPSPNGNRRAAKMMPGARSSHTSQAAFCMWCSVVNRGAPGRPIVASVTRQVNTSGATMMNAQLRPDTRMAMNMRADRHDAEASRGAGPTRRGFAVAHRAGEARLRDGSYEGP